MAGPPVIVAVVSLVICALVPALQGAAPMFIEGLFTDDQSACYAGSYNDANVTLISLTDSRLLVVCLDRCLQTSWCAAARYTPRTGACDLANVQLCTAGGAPLGERFYLLVPRSTDSSTTVTTGPPPTTVTPTTSRSTTTPATTTVTTTTQMTTTAATTNSLSFASADLVDGIQTYLGCQDAMSKGITTSGVLYINPSGTDRFPVWCNFTTGEASLTIHRRFSGALDFVSRTWADYENGFGNLSSEYWLGLRRIYQLTKTGAKLLVYLVGDKDKVFTCSYSNITILPASTNYTLFLSGYVAPSIAGTNAAQNQMTTYINRPFSTMDVDNDLLTTGNCATTRGGWWWDDCNPVYVNINGDYSKATSSCIFYQTAAETQGCHLQYISWRIVF